MYTVTNYKTKKALREALAAGVQVRCYSPGPFSCPSEGSITLEGPHYPEPHKWYATCKIAGSVLVPGTLK